MSFDFRLFEKIFYSKIQHCLESPEMISLNVPMQGYIGRPVELECVSELVTPKQQLHWSVTDYFGQDVKVDSMQVEELDGRIRSRISILPRPDSRKLDITCTAKNYVGYVEEQKTLELSCEFKKIYSYMLHIKYFFVELEVRSRGPTQVSQTGQKTFLPSGEMDLE